MYFFSVRGGLNECYHAYFSETCHKGHLFYLDKDGQYGYIAMTSLFPVGPYEVRFRKSRQHLLDYPYIGCYS